jgi:hypothetical protein
MISGIGIQAGLNVLKQYLYNDDTHFVDILSSNAGLPDVFLLARIAGDRSMTDVSPLQHAILTLPFDMAMARECYPAFWYMLVAYIG